MIFDLSVRSRDSERCQHCYDPSLALNRVGALRRAQQQFGMDLKRDDHVIRRLAPAPYRFFRARLTP